MKTPCFNDFHEKGQSKANSYKFRTILIIQVLIVPVVAATSDSSEEEWSTERPVFL